MFPNKLQLLKIITNVAALTLLHTPLSSAQAVNGDVRSEISRMHSKNPEDREEFAKELGSGSTPDVAVAKLIDLTADSDLAVRLAAISSLGNFGPSAKPALPSMLTCSRDRNDAIRISCLTSLGEIQVNDPEAIETIGILLKDRSPALRLQAVGVLFATRADTRIKVAKLVLALDDTEGDVRITAANDLGELSSSSENAVAPLGKMLGDGMPLARIAAAKALQKLDTDIDNVIPELTSAMADPDQDVRIAILKAIRNTRKLMPTNEAFTKTLSDPSPRVRKTAVETVAALWKDSPYATQLITDRLSDETNLVREAAANSAAKLTHPSAALVIALCKTLKDRDPDLRYYSAKALGTVGSVGLNDAYVDETPPEDDNGKKLYYAMRNQARSTAPDALIDALNDSDASVRSVTAQALAQLVHSEFVEFDVRKKAMDHLAAQVLETDKTTVIGSEKALVDLCKKEGDDSMRDIGPALRARLLDAIGPQLLMLSEATDNDIRYYSLELLGELPVQGDSIRPVVAALKDRDIDVQIAAVKGLGNIDFRVREIRVMTDPEAFDIFRDSEKTIRPRGLDALRNLPPKAVVLSELSKQLDSKDKEIRAAAVKSLSNDLSQVDELMGYLQKNTFETDDEADTLRIAALQAFSSPMADAYATVVAALDDSDSEVRIMAVQAFQTIEPNSISRANILRCLRNNDAKTRVVAADTMGKLGELPPTESLALVQALETDPSFAVRIAALGALDQSGDQTQDFKEALAKAMSDSSDAIRAKAIALLGQLKVYAPLLEGAQSSDVVMRQRCVDELTLSEPGGTAEIILALRKATHDPDRTVRMNAIFRLGESELGKSAVPDLTEALTDPSSLNRYYAARGLGMIGKDDATATEALNLSANTDGDSNVVQNSIDALLAIGRTEIVVANLRSPSPLARKASVMALSKEKVTTEQTVKLLRASVTDEDDSTRFEALTFFHDAGLASESAIPELTIALKDSNPKNRVLAAQTLAYFGASAKGSVSHLEEMIEDPDPAAQHEAIRTLGWIGPDAKTAIPALIKFLGNEDLSEDASNAIIKIASEPMDLRSLASSADSKNVNAIQAIQNKLDDRKKIVTLKPALYDGSFASIPIDDHTIVIVMGTWCPHSKALRDFLVDKSNISYFRNYRMIFVFEDEWLLKKRYLISKHQWNEDAANRIIAEKREMGDQPYLDPSFLNGLEGQIYTLHAVSDLGVASYPAVLLLNDSKFHTDSKLSALKDWVDVDTWKVSSWFKDHILMPDSTLAKLNQGSSLFGF